MTALLKVEQKEKGEFVYHLRTSSDSTLDSAHENASLLRLLPDSLAFRGLAEPTLNAIVEPNTGGVNIIILKVTDLEGNEIKELEDLVDVENTIAPEIEPATEINLTGKELGDFEDTAEGKKALRAAAKSEFEKLLGEWVSCPALGADVELRKIGLKKVISQSADIRKLKIIPKLKELISASKKIGEKPNYDKANSPNIIAYHTLRAVLKLAENEIAVRFVISQDDKGAYHYDHTIVSTEAVFDSALANENRLTQVSPFGLMGGNQGFTHNRSAIPEPTCLLPVEPSTGHQLDPSVVDNNENINDDFALDAVSTGGMVFNLFIEGEEPESVEPDGIENQQEIKTEFESLQHKLAVD